MEELHYHLETTIGCSHERKNRSNRHTMFHHFTPASANREIVMSSKHALFSFASQSQSTINQLTAAQSNFSKRNVFPLQFLPEELIIKVSSYLPLDIVSRLGLVSVDMHRLMQDVGLWKYKVEERWLPQLSPSILENWGGLAEFEWKQYYQMRTLLSRRGAVVASAIRAKGPSPSPRYQHTGTVVGNNIFYIGGQETQVRRFSDIYMLNTDTNRFSRIDIVGSTSPPKFARHTAVPIGHRIYVFGGFDGSGIYFDLSIFDTRLNTWTNPSVSGQPPRSRTNHAAAAVGSDLYVFGGINRDGRWELQDLDEFFVFNTITNTWKEVVCTGDLPTARCGHRLVAIDTKLYMFGGGAGDSWRERFNDIHIFDTETSVWRRVPATPLVRVCTFSSVFVMGPLIGVFGGQHLIKGKVTKKMYFFDTISETWSKQEFSHNGPNPRDMASADVVGDKVYMFGGYDGRAMDDLNVITLSQELRGLSYLNNYKRPTNTTTISAAKNVLLLEN
eukprot:gene4944-5743_t